jgi:hypothetical protein
MRTTLLAALLLCLLAGCGLGGGSEEEAPRPAATVDDGVPPEQAAKPVGEVADPLPTRAARDAEPGAALRSQLRSGAVAVVDLTGSMGIRPRALVFANGGRLDGLRWSRWDDSGAEASGEMHGVVCEPTCGQGAAVEVPATIRLSQPVACPAGRFFDRGEIEVSPADTDVKPTSWLAAPC